MTTETREFSGPGLPDVLDPLPGDPEHVLQGGNSALDDLRAALAKEVKSEPVTLVVSTRDDISVTFATNIMADTIKAWRKRCKDRTSESGHDEVRFSATVLANQAIGVVVNDKEAVGSDGEGLSFRHAEFRQMLNASSALEAVVRLYSSDPLVLATADEVLKAAGYGEEAVRADDPTTRP